MTLSNVQTVEDIRKNLITMTASPKTPKKPRRHVVVEITDAPTKHSADAFTDINDIDNIIRSEMDAGHYRKAAMFVFGINTGYRCGDTLALRVADVIDDNGGIVNELYLSEQKTGKVRTVYLNEAAKTALAMLIKTDHLDKIDYLFRGDGNRSAYLDKLVYDTDGELIDVLTTGERYDVFGNERVRAPMAVDTVARWLKKVTKKLNIYGHFSSHALRKTFTEFISRDWNDNHNAIAASAALAHSEVRTTVEHYMSVDPARLREKWLSLNLGLNAIKEYV